MELRVLRYFLAVVSESSVTKAADMLHVTQPAISRALIDLEGELGKTLLIRDKRQIKLTQDGMLLKKRAEEIVRLVDQTENEMMDCGDTLEGDIRIGCGESDALHLIARVIALFQKNHPHVAYHFSSSMASEIMARIDHGELDFGIVHGEVDFSSYEALPLPRADTWGVLMRKDDVLAMKEGVTSDDLRGVPLVVSRRGINNGELLKWFHCSPDELNICGTYDLLYNAAFLAIEGVGYVVSLDNIISLANYPDICFRPLTPRLDVPLHVIWKRHQVLPTAAKRFLQTMDVYLQSYEAKGEQ